VPPLVPHLEIDERAGLVSVRPDAAPAVFYDDCSREDAEHATGRLVPEGLRPRRTPAAVTGGRFGRVPRVYVETVQDRALAVSLQRRMHGTTPCREVVGLPSGHSPFLSMPGELARTLLRWAAVPGDAAGGATSAPTEEEERS
jgi:hypothetical protein